MRASVQIQMSRKQYLRILRVCRVQVSLALADPSTILGILEDAEDSAGVVAALLHTGGWVSSHLPGTWGQ